MSVAGSHDEDEDSLFGSPPPSSGRPPSPALALPSAGYSGSSTTTTLTQNVGTIALPGSHPYSELPINPLALSLNHGIVQRPPAPPPTAVHTSQPSLSGSLHTRDSSASSSRPKKRSRKVSRAEPPKTPKEPEFALPDPSAPPPLHFLRNQQNLLGRAGMIAGVKPAALTHVRGSTPSNPILVDDEDDTPTLGRRAQSRERSQPYIDPALLTAPTNQEIVSVLIGQKDIFPILEGVLKLVMGSTPSGKPNSRYSISPTVPPPPTGFERTSNAFAKTPTPPPTGFERTSTSTNPNPVKKRKLNRVPAGASDWDVPYPFQQGEGPEAYHKTWERERGKQLISQLIKLIKNAARKAATKKYLQEQAAKVPSVEKVEEVKINGYYRPETTYGLEVLQDASNAVPVVHPLPSQPPVTDEPMTTAAFDQLMASLNCLPDQTAGSVLHPGPLPDPNVVGADQFDTWMNFLEAFPVNFDGTGTQGTTPAATPASDFDFGTMLDTDTVDASAGSDAAGASTSAENSASAFDAMMTSIFQHELPGSAETKFEDSMIDPALLALGGTPSTATTAHPAPVTNAIHHQQNIPELGHLYIPMTATTPTASGSSASGSTTPGTPVSAAWEVSMPAVYADTQGQSNAQVWYGGTGLTDGLAGLGIVSEALGNGKGKGKAKSRVLGPANTTAAPASTSLAQVPLFQSQQRLSDALLSVTPVVASLVPPTLARQLRREDIVRRAREQRAAVQVELDEVKMRLWGTTIEQAGMVVLARKVGTGGGQAP
ncbi:hypothetical protein HYPSUDRAFT_204295 [Hypholoma sublateritium FD-334 SS-4]|uniref:Uncharacterized protein n=1 Tax=Hypholoma sublateritium (strain FD-334 SS-4) TaxID=945553 RepID=A0A0D2M962_HYPSF|nr:hypothetical protein HYPSUDRAFT_204295 [Hypholoma sublateritium FD-334 SS-4]